MVEARGFLKESSAQAVTMPTGGWGDRRDRKNGNRAPKPHAARRVPLKEVDVAQSVSIFSAAPGRHRQCFCSTFFQKPLAADE
ncbi:hypothetical protein EDM56_11590 [Brevibacillus fluminis]|uniref:Uncharacterized protein n=1 Tax=Brevibacillus fluminis TaxID=511487 RepID=A0A3M8DNW1_9BACL|nr:hypothetical protein EDM56_11590 [Brevibacillus fluminis]